MGPLRKAVFNKDLNDYMVKRRRWKPRTQYHGPGVIERMAGLFSKVFGKKEIDDYDFAPDIDFQPPEGVAVTKENPLQTHSQSTTHSTVLPSQKKKGWFFSRKEEIPIIIKEPTIPLMNKSEQDLREMKEDMKEVTRMFLKSWERLPPEQVSSLKRSDEFEHLKALLRKHELIK